MEKKNAHVLWDAWCALMGADSNHVFSRVKRGERWITRLYRAKQGFLTDKQESTLKVARRLSLYPDKTQDSVHTSLRLVYGLDDKSVLGEMEFAVRNLKSKRSWRRERTRNSRSYYAGPRWRHSQILRKDGGTSLPLTKTDCELNPAFSDRPSIGWSSTHYFIGVYELSGPQLQPKCFGNLPIQCHSPHTLDLGTRESGLVRNFQVII